MISLCHLDEIQAKYWSRESSCSCFISYPLCADSIAPTLPSILLLRPLCPQIITLASPSLRTPHPKYPLAPILLHCLWYFPLIIMTSITNSAFCQKAALTFWMAEVPCCYIIYLEWLQDIGTYQIHIWLDYELLEMWIVPKLLPSYPKGFFRCLKHSRW